jgi:hypothetical protein
LENVKEKDHLEDLDINDKTMMMMMMTRTMTTTTATIIIEFYRSRLQGCEMECLTKFMTVALKTDIIYFDEILSAEVVVGTGELHKVLGTAFLCVRVIIGESVMLCTTMNVVFAKCIH